eukprot:172144-Hanusia_phi.AAC.2
MTEEDKQEGAESAGKQQQTHKSSTSFLARAGDEVKDVSLHVMVDFTEGVGRQGEGDAIGGFLHDIWSPEDNVMLLLLGRLHSSPLAAVYRNALEDRRVEEEQLDQLLLLILPHLGACSTNSLSTLSLPTSSKVGSPSLPDSSSMAIFIMMSPSVVICEHHEEVWVRQSCDLAGDIQPEAPLQSRA